MTEGSLRAPSVRSRASTLARHARALRRFGPRGRLGVRPPSGRRQTIVGSRRAGRRRGPARAVAARGRRGRRRDCCRSTRSPTRSPRRFARRPIRERVAVAMSGGVDSAVALLRARPGRGRRDAAALARSDAGPTRSARAARPSAVIAARDACHARGLPHVTLDLREAFRRAVVTPFVRGYARGETPNPCVRCNGGFRFAELLAFARRARRRAPRDRSLRPHRRARRDDCCSRARPTSRRTRATCSPGSIRACSTASGSRSATRRRRRHAPRRRAPGSQQRAGRESQEACFLAGDDYRSFLGRQRARAAAGADRRRGRRGDRVAPRPLAFTPGQRRGLGVAARGAALRARHRRPHEHRRRRATAVARPVDASRLAAGSIVPVERVDREAPLPLSGGPRRCRRHLGASGSHSTSRRTASPSDRRPCSTTATSWSVRAWSPRRRPSGLRPSSLRRVVEPGQKAGLLPHVANATSKRS